MSTRPAPDDRPLPLARLLSFPQRMTDQVRRLVDSSLDKVFDEPFDIRSADDFERVLLQPSPSGRTGAAASALAGFVTLATPFAERTLRLVRLGGKAPMPAAKAAKYAAIAVPIGVQLSATVRRGVREMQALASYVMYRMRAEGLRPQPALVRALTVSLYVDADRRPNLAIPPGRVTGALSRIWIFRAVGTDSDQHVRNRARAWVAAVDRLDFAALVREWAGPPELTA